jgi:ubiquinone/menaquinone biosynthesis C-methylase UbiE
MTANAAQIEHWNSESGQHWVDQQDRYDRMLAPYADRLLEAAGIEREDRVLDVGCGTGTTTLRAAAAAAAVEVLGIDISQPMIARARRRAKDRGIQNARFEVADAQTVALDAGGHDLAISRFGIMFFDDPSGAFANVAAGLRADGRLAFVCWQTLAQNEWMLRPGAALAEVLPMLEPGEARAPGPFAFGDPDYVGTVLRDAGFRAVELEPLVGSILLGGGGSLDESVGWLRGTSVARALFRGADPDTVERAVASVRAALAPHEGSDGVRLGAAAWLVQARR